MEKRATTKGVCIVVLLTMVGCGLKVPENAFVITPAKLKARNIQTRRFATKDEKKLLSASASLLQDLGFTIDETESGLGVIVASKQRSAVNPVEVTGAILLTTLAALSGTYVDVRYNTDQRMRVSVITRSIGKDNKNTAVRVTFQRIVWNNKKEVTILEQLNDPKIYQEFFSKLSKSVFLEAHEL